MSKKQKAAATRKNAEVAKAKKKQARMTKGATAVATSPKAGNKKGASLIKQSTSKKKK